MDNDRQHYIKDENDGDENDNGIFQRMWLDVPHHTKYESSPGYNAI